MSDSRQAHWENVFATKPDEAVSWFEPVPETSLRLIRSCGLSPDASIIDVGAGTSRLPDALLAEGFSNITVLDISAAALARTKARLGHRADVLRFVVADITKWQPKIAVDLWHDRAMLHFLTEETERMAYANAVRRAVEPGGFVVISGFAPDGPERCSGLPVLRASQNSIAGLLGPDFDLIEAFEEEHQTPRGGRQVFVFTRFQRRR
jgi:SAM-dependent methyltransferase